MSIRYLYLIALAAVLGCAAAGSGSSGARREPNLITEQEIAGARASNASEDPPVDQSGGLTGRTVCRSNIFT